MHDTRVQAIQYMDFSKTHSGYYINRSTLLFHFILSFFMEITSRPIPQMGLSSMTTFPSLLGCALLRAYEPPGPGTLPLKRKDLYNYMTFNNYSSSIYVVSALILFGFSLEMLILRPNQHILTLRLCGIWGPRVCNFNKCIHNIGLKFRKLKASWQTFSIDS